jgi:hypothetical protein
MYIVYNIKSTMIERSYNSLGWARRYALKLNNIRKVHGREALYDVATLEDYNAKVVGMKTVINLMTGEPVHIPSNTPNCCNPATETYWSM